MIIWPIILIIYCSIFYWLRFLWTSIPELQITNHKERVTVIIPVRNEAENIGELLERLQLQSCDMELFEVIVIDDHSTDHTIQEVREFARHAQYRLKCIQLDNTQFGKKTAASVGVGHAANDIILCTDGDTRPGSDWIKSMTGPIAQDQKQMVSGPVSMTGKSFFERIQSMEFSGLIAFGAVTLHAKKPSMCNGANMAYRKEAFEKVDGYNDNLHIPSGDDEFLLQKIHRYYKGQTAFVKSKEAIVETDAKADFRALWVQRIRWTGKWRFHGSVFISFLAVFSFLFFLLLGSAQIYGAIYHVDIFFVYWLFATLGTSFFLQVSCKFHGIKTRWFDFFVLTFIYPYYAVLLGLASIFGHYSWKGRKY